jgi:hypothetical protein
MVENDASEIAECEVYFALSDEGDFGFGLSPLEAHAMMIDRGKQEIAIRSFSVRVRARKPGVELGPEINIADRDVEVAGVAETPGRIEAGPDECDTGVALTQAINELVAADPLPEASRSSHHSS